MSESLCDWKLDDRPKRGLWAPGFYVFTCRSCGERAMGDKRAVECADCAYAKPEPKEVTMTTDQTRTALPDDWEARRAAGRAWAWQGAKPCPSLVDLLASLPQIHSRRVADEIVRELAGRGYEIRRMGE